MFLLRKSTLGLVAAAATAAVFGLSCKQERTTFTQAACGTEEAEWCAPRTFAATSDYPEGRTVYAQELNDGHDAYMLYCYACHGVKGNGKGPAASGLRPSPRDFTLGIFKFARLQSSDDVPNDEDLERIVKGGLHGTAMLQWDIPAVELTKIIQYIKTFAPKKWEKKKKSGEPVKALEPFVAPADPWAGKDAEAITRGRDLYHFKAECANCHPAYGTKDELYKLSLKASKEEPDIFKPVTGFRDDPYGSVAKDSDEYKARILPPDFAFNSVRSVREKHELEDLFRVLSYGVYPIMPAWKGALSDKDIWAIAHFVKSLMDIKDTKAASDMRTKFAAQGAFEVPKPVDPAPAATPADPDKPADAADKKDGDKKDGDKKDADKKVVDKKDEKAPEKK